MDASIILGIPDVATSFVSHTMVPAFNGRSATNLVSSRSAEADGLKPTATFGGRSAAKNARDSATESAMLVMLMVPMCRTQVEADHDTLRELS